jgi:hypothetical protein
MFFYLHVVVQKQWRLSSDPVASLLKRSPVLLNCTGTLEKGDIEDENAGIEQDGLQTRLSQAVLVLRRREDPIP